jgi:hypothetical protein
MKKLSPVLALSLVTCVACGGGSTGPTPSVPVGGSVVGWSGSAKKTMSVKLGPLDSTTTWTISDVVWVEEDGELAALNPGEKVYKISSGRVTETIRQVTGPCVVTGVAEYKLSPTDGTLTVNKNGRYSGYIRRYVDDELLVTGDCGFGTNSAKIGGRMALQIDSAGAAGSSPGRLLGKMELDVAGSAHVSTWDFAAIWEL